MEYGFLLFLSILSVLLSFIALLVVIIFLPSISTNASEANNKTVWTSGTTKSVIDANTVKISNNPSSTTVYSSAKVDELDGILAERITNIISTQATPPNPETITNKTWPISILNTKFENVGAITAEEIMDPLGPYFQQLVDALAANSTLANTITDQQSFKDELQTAVNTYAGANLERVVNEYFQSYQTITIQDLNVNKIIFTNPNAQMSGTFAFDGTMNVQNNGKIEVNANGKIDVNSNGKINSNNGGTIEPNGGGTIIATSLET